MASPVALAAVLSLGLCAWARASEGAAPRHPRFSEPATPSEFGHYADQSRARSGDVTGAAPLDLRGIKESASEPIFRQRPTGSRGMRIEEPPAPGWPATKEEVAARRATGATLLSGARHAALALLLIGLTGPLRRRKGSRWDC